MPSTSSPSERSAVLYDGQTALAHGVRLHLTQSGLVILSETTPPEAVAFTRLRLGDRGAGGRVTLRHAEKSGWRLVIPEGVPPAWLKQLKRAGRPALPRLALWGGIAAATAAGIGLLALNGNALIRALAPLVPNAMLEPLGRELAQSLGGAPCDGPAGQQALEKLARRLSPPGGFAAPVAVSVVNRQAVNAVALPGGRVLIFSKLIEDAQSADEVAGVLAHELGHVHHLHTNQAILRQMGLGLFLQTLGGNVGALADTSLMLAHSRAAEREADAFAARQLGRARISTAGMAAFFTRLDAREKAAGRASGLHAAVETLGTYAATHPAPQERAQRLLRAGLSAGQGRPALGAAEWQALRAICATG